MNPQERTQRLIQRLEAAKRDRDQAEQEMKKEKARTIELMKKLEEIESRLNRAKRNLQADRDKLLISINN